MFTEGPDAPVTAEWTPAPVLRLVPSGVSATTGDDTAGRSGVDAGLAADRAVDGEHDTGHDCLLAAACAGFWEVLAAMGDGDLARAYAALREPVVEDLPALAERLVARGGRATSVILTAR